MTATKETQFSKEELKQLQEVKDKYDALTIQLGQIELEQLVLTTSKETIVTSFNELRITETQLANKKKKKYGKGQLNLETGVFVSED